MNIKIKRIVVLVLGMNCITRLMAYESGFEIEDMEQSMDCLAILQRSCSESPSLWAETHCGKTADTMVTLLSQQGFIEQESTAYESFDNFENSAMGKKLLANSKQNESLLFHINVCGRGHVFVVEKDSAQESGWRIFQSWQNEFNLTEWLALERWENKKFHNDYIEYGQGQRISQTQLISFISQQKQGCKERMQRFRNLMTAVPYELEISCFSFNKHTNLSIKVKI